VSVEKDSDDFVVRGERPSNWEIAGSPRRYLGIASHECFGGRALDGLGGLTVLPNPTKLRIPESNVRESHGGC